MATADDNLEKFLHSFNDRVVSINRQWTAEELQDMREAAKELVERIISVSFRDYIPQEDIGHHILPVRSAYEGTQIDEPKDFDFTIILPFFSENNVKVINDCKEKVCKCGRKSSDGARAHIIYTGDVNVLPQEMRHLINDDSYVWNLATARFFEVNLKEALNKIFEDNNKMQPKIEKPTGALELGSPHASRGDTVAFTPFFQWMSNCDKKQVHCSIDLAFAIRLNKAWGISLEDCPKRLQNEVEAGACHVLPSMDNIAENPSYGRFLISFVEAETLLIRRLKDKGQWFICYQLVKILLKRIVNDKSYIVKTIVLRLAYDSESSDQKPTLADCVVKVVRTVLRLLEKPEVGEHKTLGSIWFKTHILLLLCVNEMYEENDDNSPFSHMKRLEKSGPNNLRYIKELLKLFEEIRNDTAYEYKRYCCKVEAIMEEDKQRYLRSNSDGSNTSLRSISLIRPGKIRI